MIDKLPISAFVIAKNEADRIGLAIAGLRSFVEEIIVIDSGSDDNTVKVAESSGARVIHHNWAGYGAQKRFGENQCRNRWLLNIDADEEITPQLAEEIRGLFAGGAPQLAGFILRIRDLLPGETKLAPFAHTNYALRLYNRDKASFSDHAVHDTVQVGEGKTRMLTSPVLHRSFRSLAHAIDKMNDYTTMQAEYLSKRGVAFAGLRLITEFPLAFFKDYILRGYILRGRRGFVNSILYGFTRFIRIAKYLECR